MNVGIVLCSRSSSERLPMKALRKVNGLPVIEHLVKRLVQTNLMVFIATPENDVQNYTFLEKYKNLRVFGGSENDPLKRIYECALAHRLDVIIRVTHDKIFVDPFTIRDALDAFEKRDLDYLYSSKFIDGTGFEIISFRAIEAAAEKFKDVEFIGYAVRLVTENQFNYTPKIQNNEVRLLIDYPEDLALVEVILSRLGNECGLIEVLRYLDYHQDLMSINALPILTIYTCAYDSAEYLERCMKSVSRQIGFEAFEYILIDDFSTDKTIEQMALFCAKNRNSRWIRNGSNLGLASSSNVALKNARGKYIMRIDSDDFFCSVTTCKELLHEIIETAKEAIYPNNFLGNYDDIQKGREFHHVGGAIFDKRAINFIKFTDGLRGYEGYDFFERAKDKLRIGYYNKPTFFYSQRNDSLSHQDPMLRKEIKDQINASLGI